MSYMVTYGSDKRVVDWSSSWTVGGQWVEVLDSGEETEGSARNKDK